MLLQVLLAPDVTSGLLHVCVHSWLYSALQRMATGQPTAPDCWRVFAARPTYRAALAALRMLDCEHPQMPVRLDTVLPCGCAPWCSVVYGRPARAATPAVPSAPDLARACAFGVACPAFILARLEPYATFL